jgi:hypothetical protein
MIYYHVSISLRLIHDVTNTAVHAGGGFCCRICLEPDYVGLRRRRNASAAGLN